MKVHYDEEVDALYLQLDEREPDGVVEIAEGINLDTIGDGGLAGIEILDASRKLDLGTLLSYSLELDRDILTRKRA